MKHLLYYLTKIWRGQGTLGKRFLSGTAVVFSEKLLIKGIQFIRTVIVARLLFPDDLGLFAMVSMAMGITDVFFQTGFVAAIIHEEDPKKHIDSAWSVNVLRGIGLSALLFFGIAPLAGKFFDYPPVVPLARAISLTFLISGFENIAMWIFQKELRFIRLTLFSVSGFTIQAIVTIIAAFVLRNAWALVLGLIASRITFLILSFVIHPYRPRFTLDLAGAKHLFKYGKWFALTGVLTFLISQGDSATVGKLLDSSSLGFYQIAFGLGMIPAVEFVRSFSSILFPLYVKVRDDRERLKDHFLKISRVIFSFSLPASLGLLALAPEAVQFIYGERWLPLVPALYILIFLGITRSFEFSVAPVFWGIGKPKVQTAILVTQASVMFALIVPLTKQFGMIGTAGAVLLAGLVVGFIYALRLRKETGIGLRALSGIFILPVISSILMAGILITAKGAVPIESISWLFGYVVAGIGIYLAVLLLLDHIFGRKNFYNSLLWIKGNII